LISRVETVYLIATDNYLVAVVDNILAVEGHLHISYRYNTMLCNKGTDSAGPERAGKMAGL